LLEKNAIASDFDVKEARKDLADKVAEKMEKYLFNEALEVLWQEIKANDELLTQKAPWKMTDKEEIAKILLPVAESILSIGYLLRSFMPKTSAKIIKSFSEKQIKKIEPLFLRLVK